LSLRDFLQDCDALIDRWMGVEQAMRPAFVVLQGVVDAHRRGRVVETGERLVVLLELL
jgi:hypothetical protein